MATLDATLNALYYFSAPVLSTAAIRECSRVGTDKLNDGIGCRVSIIGARIGCGCGVRGFSAGRVSMRSSRADPLDPYQLIFTYA